MTKDGLIARILAHLEREIDVLAAAARAAHEGATGEESKSEHQYDTRAIEASYLAGAQAERAGELRRMRLRYQRLEVRDFDDDDAIGLTALVELERDGEARWYFLGPCGGGIKLDHSGSQVVVITPAAPLGRQLLGKEVGDPVTVRGPAGVREYEIANLL